MKKEYILLILLVILLIPPVFSQQTESENIRDEVKIPSTQQTDNKRQENKEETDVKKAMGDLDKALDKAKESGALAEVDEKIEKEIEIPERIQPVVRVLFRFEDKITVSQLIIAIMLTLLIMLFFMNILSFFSPFGGEIGKLMGIILTIIVSTTGTIKTATNTLLGMASHIKFVEDWSAGSLTFSLLLVLVSYWIIFKFIKKAKEHRGLIESKEEGARVGADLGFLQGLRNMFSRVTSRVTNFPLRQPPKE